MTTVRQINQYDYEKWNGLYSAYADFYNVIQTQAMRDKVWAWLQDTTHEVNGLVAISNGGEMLGLVHYRTFSRPLSATYGGFIDDLFVSPSTRGKGIGKALIRGVTQIGKENNWSVVRWITAEDNQLARTVYDQVAAQTKWVTYDLRLD